ncbi:MAG: ABC transporter ATP-binding protein [Phycisphaeraceae bacterium]|nr:ABC transporter ATP-binding protein [Phycisphaeraceae bacterium]
MTPAPDAMVVCQQVTKVFKDFWMRDRVRAVGGLTFDIRPREIFGLLGPNGSGKSTTIKLILGLLRPTAGRIALFGRAPSDVEVKRRIGYLPEESYLYGFLNARETLEYYAKLFEIDYRTRSRRIEELLDMLGLAGAQFRPVREYSKGMQRRIGIAQALINDPDLLILDEPTTGLDPIGTRQIKDLILELGRRGKTVLLSSHLLADVEDCVDRLIILYGGQKRAEGTCDDLLVSQSRTTIEADTLDEQTLAEIDRVIRQRSDGNKSITRVSKPRQSLEALFLQIVERAQSEQVATSGATAGGKTAAFLRAQDEPAEGEDLISRLTADAPQAPAAVVQGGPPSHTEPQAPQTGPDDSVISSLVTDEPAAKAPRAAPAAPTARPEAKPGSDAVDRSVIGSLLGDEPPNDKPDSPGAPR